MPGPDPTFLQDGETPLVVQRRHPLSALDSWIGIAILVLLADGAAFVVAAFIVAEAAPYAVAAAAVVTLLGIAAGVAVWFRVRTSLSVVTAERVYHAHGQWRFFLSQTTYDRVTDLHVHQSLFGRRLGFGTVLVQTAGQGVALVGVRDPLGTKVAIEEAREAMVRRLVSAHARATRTSSRVAKADGAAAAGDVATPRPAPALARVGGPAIWTGAPTTASLVAAVLPTLLFAIPFALFSLAGSRFTGPAGLLVPAALVVFIGISIVGAIIRQRTTRFEVHAWGVAVGSGWLGRRRVEARYEKVTDVTVTQGVWGRMFGFGTIAINTAGSNAAPINFAGVRDPDQVKAIVDQARAGTQA